MLKISSQLVIEEFAVLFNCILKSGADPDVWRDNIIKPIYEGGGQKTPQKNQFIKVGGLKNQFIKVGGTQDPSKEPIYKGGGGGGGLKTPQKHSGCSCFGKLLSRLLFNRLDKYIEDNELICPEQIGFRKKV